ncbi:MAG: 4Fe-4S binding protein [Firmicutes bacterium]|nr:4Fe-4S binding protein [Bacillota bacterium]
MKGIIQEVQEVLGEEFDRENVRAILKRKRVIVLTKTHYLPFEEIGDDYYEIDAYYVASNAAYHKLSAAMKKLQKKGISVERYKKTDFKKLAVESELAYGCRRNSLAYDENGSRFVLGAIEIVGAENLPEKEKEELPKNGHTDASAAVFTLCGRCNKCMDACPTKAITNTAMEGEKCLRHYQEEPNYPQAEIIEAAKNKLLGCDICQRSCPFNKQKIVPVPLEFLTLLKKDGFWERAKEKQIEFVKWIGINYARKLANRE